MLTDEAVIMVSGGHGGLGKASFFKMGVGPDGGNGGKGGDLYFQTTSDLTALNRFASHTNFSAGSGDNGGSNRKSGLNANDLILLAPMGTDILDLETEELFSLNLQNQAILLCKGGIGGQGNADRANSRMTTPIKAQSGLPGQKRKIRLTLKLIADFGLVGLPNAGKSSLLNALTAANAKIGDYPFTTLEPNLGVFNGKVIADIPGLIEGASTGKGLGFRFLKHIEKVSVILHCVAADSLVPKSDYKIVRDELKKFNSELINKKEVIIRTKCDICKPKGLKGINVSVLDDESLEELKKLFTT